MSAAKWFKMVQAAFRKMTNWNGTTLRDGTAVSFRPIDADDYEAILNIYQNLGEASQYLRFNAAVTATFIKKVARQTVEDCANQGRGVLAIATLKDGRTVPVGQARYVMMGNNTAELCITIQDAYHGQGLGKLLMKQLVASAKEAGVDELIAYVNSNNAPMRALLYKLCLPVLSEGRGQLASYRLVLNPNAVPELALALAW